MVGLSSPVLIYIVLIVLIICCLFWLTISIIKKYTIGKIISIILILLLSYPFFDIYYKSYFFKNNVKKDLNILNFQLNDDFEILSSVGSDDFLGKSQITTIEISNEDKLRLIDQIVQSKNYKELKDENESSIAYDKAYPPEYFFNVKYPEYYTRKITTKIENKEIEIDLKIDLFRDVIEYSKWEK
ncbi:hypothetical protein PG637_09160 [Riemerella anatipestifer]|nr:hypothetical protein [Riemerella anatipestifer]MDY3325832.1 hypothetical protein [Riemerella anatipestifer]MDY3354374.1 hypothetical protein [Riemerella anatipestifer]